ncbi:hypothetical protein HOY80DRAFT_1055919 [Tuber brumale]|nr:hypothetical protein HOY80DRAFT_1055919 [Tuber brumale]
MAQPSPSVSALVIRKFLLPFFHAHAPGLTLALAGVTEEDEKQYADLAGKRRRDEVIDKKTTSQTRGAEPSVLKRAIRASSDPLGRTAVICMPPSDRA